MVECDPLVVNFSFETEDIAVSIITCLLKTEGQNQLVCDYNCEYQTSQSIAPRIIDVISQLCNILNMCANNGGNIISCPQEVLVSCGSTMTPEINHFERRGQNLGKMGDGNKNE